MVFEGSRKTGTGVSKNYQEAALWYLKAAERGIARAEYNIGVEQDSEEAQKWYRQAADRGNRDAKAKLTSNNHTSSREY